MKPDIQSRIYGSGFLIIAVGVVAAVFFMGVLPFLDDQPSIFIETKAPSNKVHTFESDDAFHAYLTESQSFSNGGGLMMARMANTVSADFGVAMPMMAMESTDGNMLKMEESALGYGGGGGVDRVSETNVQVQGIDEPDIVKTNGEEIFVSSPYYAYPAYRGGVGVPEPLFDTDVLMEDVEVMIEEKAIAPGYFPPVERGGVHAVSAFPPAELALDSTIKTSGDLLLVDDTLLVFSYNSVQAYNVSNPEQPEATWNKQLEDQQSIITSRLMGDTVYVVAARYAGYGQPCPIPFIAGEDAMTIACTSIYRPDTMVPVDSTYTVMAFDAASGDVKDTLSFVGSRSNTTVYMSPESLYVVYQRPLDTLPFLVGFLQEKAGDVIPNELLTKLARLQSYDIGRNAKMTEMQELWNRYIQTLDNDEQIRIETELTNRMTDYYESHKRELATSGIMKISVQDLKLESTGSVPGYLLNQFSLDEYNGDLRVATTVGEQWFGLSGIGSTGESVNDVYVLDDDLDIVGSVQDLGRGERIYSARFIGDRGYVVTFKQIDPFFVLDLADPKHPSVEGELKIPGFSSYLHPIDEHRVLGIGRENSQVKMTMFNVSDPQNPEEQSTYRLNEYWSDVQNTHHAFLLDEKHEVFFLPGGNAGYVMSYADNTLSLKKAVGDIRARRALFINDYLYVVGEDQIVVINENDWERVNELDLQ